MKKFQEIGETTKYPPEEVVREILLRLPVKSLLRFRSVCKSWLSLISDPLFAESHFELASDRFLYLTASLAQSIDVDESFHDDSAVATLNLPITAPLDRIVILGSCRGFVLLGDYYNRNLFVWNPSTSWYKKLPYYPTPYELYPYVGFGYDSSKDDYLIVITSYDESADNFGTHIDFFSLKNNSWRNVEGTHPYTSHMDYHYRGVFLNGAIHWLAYRFGSGGGVIVAFDLIQKNVKELPLPDDYGVDLEMYTCEVLGGCFSIFIVGEFRTEIWIMKEYGVKSSWSKSIMVSIEEIPIKYFSPVCITKSGEIVGIYNDGGLMKCKHDGKLLEHRMYGIRECNAAMYRESLLSFTS